MRTLSTPLILLAVAASCAHANIEGTQIEGTDENRAVFAVIRTLQDALRDRDADKVLGLVSTNYFEDMGTPTPDDDYGYHELKGEILPDSMEVTAEYHISMIVHDIIVDGEKAHADIRYKSRARVELPAGAIWDSHKEFNRVELAWENNAWRIVAGL